LAVAPDQPAVFDRLIHGCQEIPSSTGNGTQTSLARIEPPRRRVDSEQRYAATASGLRDVAGGHVVGPMHFNSSKSSALPRHQCARPGVCQPTENPDWRRSASGCSHVGFDLDQPLVHIILHHSKTHHSPSILYRVIRGATTLSNLSALRESPETAKKQAEMRGPTRKPRATCDVRRRVAASTLRRARLTAVDLQESLTYAAA